MIYRTPSYTFGTETDDKYVILSIYFSQTHILTFLIKISIGETYIIETSLQAPVPRNIQISY